MTASPATEKLKVALETMHGGTATFVQSVPVMDAFNRKTAWECVVHIFSLTDNPKATRAYAWSASLDADEASRFFAYLHVPPVHSPVLAVRAAIMQHMNRSNDA